MKVLITGTTMGIGNAIAKKFLDNGHEVIGIDREEQTKEQKEHPNFTFYHFDIIEKEKYPKLDNIEVIINNAGSLIESEAVNNKLMGAYYITETYAFQPSIKAVINISSNSAHYGIELPLYCITNGGIISYTKNLAKRLAQYNATVNSISPGYVDTTLDQHIKDANIDSQIYEHCLLHHIQKPEEIAELCYYLSVINKSITGQDILIDCGECLSMEFVETEENLKKYYSGAKI